MWFKSDLYFYFFCICDFIDSCQRFADLDKLWEIIFSIHVVNVATGTEKDVEEWQ